MSNRYHETEVPDSEVTPQLIDKIKVEPELRYGSRRICIECGEPRDKAEFKVRRHPRSGRMFLDPCCRPCRKMRTREKARRRVAREKQIQFRDAIQRLRGQSIKAPHVSEVWAELVTTWGGLTKFVQEYKAQIDVAIANNPGSKVVLDAFKSIGGLSVHSSALRQSAPDMASMTDAEIEDQIRLQTMRVLKSDPKMLQDMISSGKIDPASLMEAVSSGTTVINPDYADPHSAAANTQEAASGKA